MAPKILTWEDCNLPSPTPLLKAASITKSGLVITSGQVGVRSDGTIPETVEEQTKLAIEQLEIVLKAAGSSLGSVLKVLLFVTDPELIPKVNAVYATYFTNAPPRSCVVVKLGSPKLFVELEATAELD
ncbi:hypothetical protein CANARDRAFT_9216 [[Candida] arabinofermentans NRRL YB-2248]|uniref:Uncharacterized protein n=1 Tax=[Candida] arabinofermentans NRRL YB-2248 TaxID=983967 RepID=A0A1E4SWQ6_9ASCO|nr:hypothetical protein CANARDRAFT_9216 [[Candida] arabinofermentans NRRL YB-2248]